ncbi:hypothetical protein Q1W70_26815 [Pseudomonas kielensis]|jgi:hypothetical protein|uniref:hypothetical protein n=1 Tax=Pseudomonas TaxID=286 RepID=UPI0014129EFB|nr:MULTISPECIES: hypothetical protein [Pseudomonas]NBB36952.1 hypothetical protein [Pseudomonas sp. BC115LW]UZM14938.1 hypothetical protein LZV00_03890 [Pseudomonas kielensis]WKL52974.1 hypothetical protein Q1W70_26815 [Pseudomonas kielensis]
MTNVVVLQMAIYGGGEAGDEWRVIDGSKLVKCAYSLGLVVLIIFHDAELLGVLLRMIVVS